MRALFIYEIARACQEVMVSVETESDELVEQKEREREKAQPLHCIKFKEI